MLNPNQIVVSIFASFFSFFHGTIFLLHLPLIWFFVMLFLCVVIVMCIVGGIVISFSIAGILWHLCNRQVVTLKEPTVFRALVFGCLCFVVISWEVCEFRSLVRSGNLGIWKVGRWEVWWVREGGS